MTLLEICIDDLAGAIDAETAGADRVELCANLIEGGTTPSYGLISRVYESVTRIGVQLMVRPRGGDFVYSSDERSVMLADIRFIRDLTVGAKIPVGIVLGALTSDGRIDVPTMHALMAEAGGLPVTFHKAFDATRDLPEALSKLTELGVVRVLTSGGAATALEGAAMLRTLTAQSSEAVAVLAGGGVRPAHVAELIARSGVGEVHLRAQAASIRHDGTLQTDGNLVAEMVRELASANFCIS
jgi:copper homeostasis protein CutC